MCGLTNPCRRCKRRSKSAAGGRDIWISRCWPDRYANFCSGLWITANIAHSYQFDDQKRPANLGFAEVRDDLDWLEANRDHAKEIGPGAAVDAQREGACNYT